MNFAKKALKFWQILRKNWTIKYCLIIRNDSTHHDSFSLRLSPKNIFVTVTTSAIILIVLTAMLIAFTPLRVYVPGYTNPDEYRQYKKAAKRVDSVELVLAKNQQYYDNLARILNDKVMPAELEQEVPESGIAEESELSANPSPSEIKVREMSSQLTARPTAPSTSPAVAVNKKAHIESLFLITPTEGTIISYYNVPKNQYGIDIQNRYNALINSVANGIVIYAGYDVVDGNVIIVQHHDNVISIYKHNSRLLKNKGAQVEAGEPIAQMGNSGITDKGVHLHFEIWHNGFPLNPLDYLTLK